MSENRHNSEFIFGNNYHSRRNIYIANFIRPGTGDYVGHFPGINYLLHWCTSHLYEFDKRDWKYICHVASLQCIYTARRVARIICITQHRKQDLVRRAENVKLINARDVSRRDLLMNKFSTYNAIYLIHRVCITYIHMYISTKCCRGNCKYFPLHPFTRLRLSRTPATHQRIPSSEMRAHVRVHTRAVEYSLNSRLAKAIYEDPRVKAMIRRRHGAADKSTPRIWILCILQQCRFPGIVISAREYVFVNLREILDWRAWNLLKSRAFDTALRPDARILLSRSREMCHAGTEIFLMHIFSCVTLNTRNWNGIE